MKILALEFSSGQRSVAALIRGPDGRVLSTSEVVETGGRETKAIGMIEEALRQLQIEREQIDVLAIGLGPGSYTGIRMAIALTQGWQLAVGVKVLGISSAEVLAAQAQREGIEGAVSVVIDAQRNEFYLVRFDLAGPGMTQLEPLRLAQISEIHALQESGARIIGPEAPKHFAGAEGLFPSATILAQLVPQRLDGVPAQDLEPIYLRKTSFVKATQPAARPASQ